MKNDWKPVYERLSLICFANLSTRKYHFTCQKIIYDSKLIVQDLIGSRHLKSKKKKKLYGIGTHCRKKKYRNQNVDAVS